MARRLFLILAASLASGAAQRAPAAEESVSFTRDVMAVLSRGGCNGGGCHGHRDGKGALHLSLWGESPAKDFKALTARGRLVDVAEPERSRLLRKPTLQIAHQGKKRFDVGSRDYEVLLGWLRSGATDDTTTAPALTALQITPALSLLTEPVRDLQLKVTATFANGERRDVTYWAVYSLSNFIAEVDAEGKIQFQKRGETTVTARFLNLRATARLALIPARPDFVWTDPPVANYVDEHVFKKLKKFRRSPAELCDDVAFVRRAYLDIIGVLPTEEEARAFVGDNTTPNKREALVDRLLERPEFAEFWALKWSDLLRNEEKALDRKGVKVFYEWIRASIAEGKGLDSFTRELLTARGSTYEHPPANFYRSLRNPVERAEATAQVFLGARLRCAKCHNHPFDRWTQDEYYEFAALFDGIQYEIVENKRRDKFDKNQFIGEQRVKLVDERKFKDPRSGAPPHARLLGRETPALEADRDRFAQLADWITSPANSLFAKVQANRIWFNMLGRGLVEPVDDFRATNPASHPELLDALAQDLIDSGYEIRALVRRIATSRTYQLASSADGDDGRSDRDFASAPMPRLSAEVLLDAAHAALDVPPAFKHQRDVRRATALPGIEGAWLDKNPHDDDRFLRLFGKPQRLPQFRRRATQRYESCASLRADQRRHPHVASRNGRQSFRSTHRKTLRR